jgi:hypothetical protein
MAAESDEPARVRLGVWPTPIEPMPRLARAVGLDEPLGVAAAVGVVLLMSGAIGVHLRTRLLGTALISPLAVFAVAVLAAVLRTLTA